MPSRYRDVYVDVVAPKKDDKPKPSALTEFFEFVGKAVLIILIGFPIAAVVIEFWSRVLCYPYGRCY